jgi:hypothetical protein
MREVDRLTPVHYQEPFRRGYTQWEPVAADFLADLRGAVTGGDAGWCLHNGTQRNAPDQEPRRSFDLRTRRLFDQLDSEERKVVAEAAAVLGAGPDPQVSTQIYPRDLARLGKSGVDDRDRVLSLPVFLSD